MCPLLQPRGESFWFWCAAAASLVRDAQSRLQPPLDVPDLQIVFLAPPGGEVKAGETVIKFDPEPFSAGSEGEERSPAAGTSFTRSGISSGA